VKLINHHRDDKYAWPKLLATAIWRERAVRWSSSSIALLELEKVPDYFYQYWFLSLVFDSC
jgi:hypothetical protein